MSTSVAGVVVTHAQDVQGARAKIYSILCSAPHNLSSVSLSSVRLTACPPSHLRSCSTVSPAFALAYQCAKWQSGSPCSRWHFACTEMCLISIQSNFDNELPGTGRDTRRQGGRDKSCTCLCAIALTSTHTHAYPHICTASKPMHSICIKHFISVVFSLRCRKHFRLTVFLYTLYLLEMMDKEINLQN